MRRRVVIVGLIIAALAGGFLVVRATGRASPVSDQAPPAQQAQAQQQAPAPVTVVAARRADLITSVTATGTVASLREAKIAPQVSGRVAQVLVREGQRVQAGTPLMRLDARDLSAQAAQAQASVAMARARLALLLAGARAEERRQAADAAAQAQAGVQAAQARLQALERGARPQERDQAANAVAQAKAQLDLAQIEAQRMRSLFQMGAISRQQLDSAETQLRLVQAAHDSARQQQALVNEGPRVEEIMAARAQLAQAQAAADAARQSLRLVELGARSEEIAMTRAQLHQAEALAASAQIRLHDATVAAPFAGTVTQRLVEPGETVSPATPAFVVAQVDEVYAELAVPERHRAALRQGQQAGITIDALPGQRFVGRIEEIQPAATIASRSFTVKVRVPNAQGALRPGMFARGTITLAVRRNVLQIPDTAVLLTTGRSIVFVVQDGKAIRREVAVGESQNGTVEVKSGLNDGDQVVTAGAEGLTDNQPVAPRAPQQ